MPQHRLSQALNIEHGVAENIESKIPLIFFLLLSFYYRLSGLQTCFTGSHTFLRNHSLVFNIMTQ